MQMVWSTVVLFLSIGLLEIVWKIIEIELVMNWYIVSRVRFHDCLYIFVATQGTSTVYIKNAICLLHLQKVFDTVDQYILLEILEGYGFGPNMQGLLHFY